MSQDPLRPKNGKKKKKGEQLRTRPTCVRGRLPKERTDTFNGPFRSLREKDPRPEGIEKQTEGPSLGSKSMLIAISTHAKEDNFSAAELFEEGWKPFARNNGQGWAPLGTWKH